MLKSPSNPNLPASISAVFVGSQSLLIRCAERFLEKGHQIAAIISDDAIVIDFATKHQLPQLNTGRGLTQRLRRCLNGVTCDYLFSVAHLKLLPPGILAVPELGAINFHDGILPDYAGLNVTSWSLLRGESEHGVTWHEMERQVDAGRILSQRRFPVADSETALSLNAKCYEAAFESFDELVDQLTNSTTEPIVQDLTNRSYFGKYQRPEAAGCIAWNRTAAETVALIRAMDFGSYPNPLTTAKTWIGDHPLIVRKIERLESTSNSPPGTISRLDDRGVMVATGTQDVLITEFADSLGRPLSPTELQDRFGLTEGDRFRSLDEAEIRGLTELNATLCKHEDYWVERLQNLEALPLPYVKSLGRPYRSGTDTRQTMETPAQFLGTAASDIAPGHWLAAAAAAFLSRIGGRNQFDLARQVDLAEPSSVGQDLFSTRVPVSVALRPENSFADFATQFSADLDESLRHDTYAIDVAARYSETSNSLQQWHDEAAILSIFRVPQLSAASNISFEAALTLEIPDDAAEVVWHFDSNLLSGSTIARMQSQFLAFLNDISQSEKPIAHLNLLSAAEACLLINTWNQTKTDYDRDRTIHQLFEQQVERTPDAIAIEFEGDSWSYSELNSRANQIAHYLLRQGVVTDSLVGVLMDRSNTMVAAMLGILKSGAAYVPLDAEYPAQSLAHMVTDSQLCSILSHSKYASLLPGSQSQFIPLDAVADDLLQQPTSNPKTASASSDLAYVIYTSGSTGKPKGVMVEHGNVVNFFVGMDQRLDGRSPGTWLAVTSISFDISVLEIFWTLSRGFKILLYGGEQTSESTPDRRDSQPIDFSLFYFASNENENESQKYRLLLEGSRFADQNGFEAVWTPERHFHAFGGLYPNPSVASAAIAAITEKVQIRAGSCVLPLHSPIRIVEEWSVVDNLSAGRVGISFAAGWQPNDFVIAPDNYEERQRIFMEGVETVRELWRGEPKTFTGPLGEVAVQTLPRPIQPELPVWVTAAGNPETFRSAGRIGANMLTHLLGQSVEELAGKLEIYRQAWADAGHPGSGRVSLMLHTFIAEDEAFVREQVYQPLKNYLRSATNLVKQHASSFPAFRNAQREGANIDNIFNEISERDMEALLEHSFNRYYETSGLFGTPDGCLQMVDDLKAIGVDEIACLVDFGIPSETVLSHLPHLNQLRQNANPTVTPGNPAADYSLAALLRDHEVTHLQCTPSMATMLTKNPQTRDGLKQLTSLLVGGEAFPVELAEDLESLVSGRVINMYGPTETTIWSATQEVRQTTGTVPIGTPISNTQIYIMDANRQLLPTGVAGELLIGGEGVVRGYLHREQLTAERFIADPYHPGQRLYRTGDLARWREDGILEFLGRIDNQVKIRGHRIELGEIETVLSQHRAIQQAVVVAREDSPGDKRLVGYVVPEKGTTANTSELRDHLKHRLPEFMIPSAFVSLDQFPMTPNKKVDRKRLPTPDSARPDLAIEFVAPRTEQEQILAGFFAEVLNREEVGIHDDFVELGGDSLSAVEVFVKIQQEFQVDFPLFTFFEVPTVAGLANKLNSQLVSNQAEDVADMELLIEQSME